MQISGNSLAAHSREPQSDHPERRQCVRQKIHIPAYANLGATSGGTALDLSEILDISEHGMCIQTATVLARHLSLPVVLDLAETKAFLCTTGTVVWSDSSGRAGISFSEMPAEPRQQLKEWLFANAIAACVNHVEASAPMLEEEMLESAGGSFPGSDDEVEQPVRPDYTSILIALAAVKREVDSAGRDLERALGLVADRAQTFTRAGGAAIALADGSNQDEIVCRGCAGPDAPPLGTRLDLGSSFSGECIRTGKVLRCEDSETDLLADRESCRLLGIRSMVAVPVRDGDAVIGLLEVFSPQPGAFIANDEMILQRMAGMISSALRSAAEVPPAKVLPLPALPVKGSLSLDSEFPDSDFANHGLVGFDLNPRSVSAEPFSSLGSATVAKSSTPWAGRVLLVASAATLTAVLLWVAVPWAKSWLHALTPTHSPQPKSSRTISKAPDRPAQAGGSESMQRLAERGDPVAQFEMGARYATGEEVAQDYPQALSWFSKAAEQGNVAAQATLGAYYWAGRGVPQDLSKAYYWAILARAGGDEGSKYRVALLASRLSRAQILAEQKRAEDWIKLHQTLTKNVPPSAE
jgi:putative methionine-R-sulfoxide reductase with GAF domain